MSDQPAEKTEKRIAVTVTPTQAQRLRVLGAEVDLSTGLLTRALVQYGLDHADDEATAEAVRGYAAEVRKIDRKRRRDVGERVMTERHKEKKET